MKIIEPNQMDKAVSLKKPNSTLRVRSTVYFERSIDSATDAESKNYSDLMKGYFKEADKLIDKLKGRVPKSSKGMRLDLEAQIENVKRKRVELQLKLDKSWRNNRKTWAIFKEEFEKENKNLVRGYELLLRNIKGTIEPNS